MGWEADQPQGWWGLCCVSMPSHAIVLLLVAGVQGPRLKGW